MNNPSDGEIKKLLTKSKTIAIVGLSDNQSRESYSVGEYLKGKGFTVIPVNPVREFILGEKSYPDLKSIPVKVDIVDVFRNLEAVPGVVEEAISIRPKAIWLQLDLTHEGSAEKAAAENIMFVQDRCIKVEHARLFG